MSYLGIDVGSLFIGLSLTDENGNVVQQEYLRHHGEPLKCLAGLLERIPASEIRNITRTGAGGKDLPLPGDWIDPLVAVLEGVRRLVPDARNILSVGGSSFSLTQLDDSGAYSSSKMNSACASGTGSFLDQQAERLQISPSELAQKAIDYKGKPPGVATRCAVFAKSDMIHLQQEGYTVDAITAGLCAGLGASTVDGLLGGRRLTGKTVITGGVARNPVVVRGIREKLGVETVVPDFPELAGAYGASLMAGENKTASIPEDWKNTAIKAASAPLSHETESLRAPLELRLSQYPDFKWHDHWINDDQSEIAIVEKQTGLVSVTLGIDIGSTSTKTTALNREKQVVGWVYRKTAGDPIRAVQLVFKALREMEQRGGFTLDINGVGTTGSGRKMIKAVVGADIAVNEITAHARAAVFIDPEVDTIIELGGQDAKFTQLQNGMVYNSVMNYVCAAGTGSFIEEQAVKLGIPLNEFAQRAMGQICPRTSDRCTVYMERDLAILMARGWEKNQIAAAVLHSVRDNYLNKVVSGLHIGEHIYFQGATARNPALVAAFEAELQKPIKVSPYCHLTGSLGMSLLAMERVPDSRRAMKFKGLAFAEAKVTVHNETCKLCRNLCNLSIIQTGDDVVAWGMKCGRDYSDKHMRPGNTTTYQFWKERANAWLTTTNQTARSPTTSRPRIGLSRSLAGRSYYPFWQAFFAALDCETILSPQSSDKLLKRGIEIAAAEYCAPVMISHGHVLSLLENPDVDFVFLPHMLREPVPPGFTNAHFCSYIQAHPSVITALDEHATDNRLVSPVIDLHASDQINAKALFKTLGKPLGITMTDILRGLRAGHRAQHTFQAECLSIGRKAMTRIEEENALGIVCLGRPYNTTDPGLTLDLPRKIAEMGYYVLYMDMIPFNLSDILPEYSNMYWHYGQKILAAAKYITRTPRLFGLFFSNFMCGPDSYILSYFKDIMGQAGKPYLCLQFDGHGADAGYLTRVEAAVESFHSWSAIPRPQQN